MSSGVAAKPVPEAPDEPGSGERAALVVGGIGSFLVIGVAGFVLLYLTDVVGLSAASVGTLLLVARIVDGILDPVIGYVVDHLPPTRWGRFRGTILVGAALSSLSLVALFTVPAFLGPPLLSAWVLYLAWGAAIGVMAIPMVSLLPVITASAVMRSRLAGALGVTGLLASAAITALTLPAVDVLGGGRSGWAWCAVLVAVLGFALIVVQVLCVRERVQPTRSDQYGLADVKRMFFADRAVGILLVCKIAVQSASGALAAILPLFFRDYLGDERLLSVAALVMAVPMGAGAIVIPRAAARTDTRRWYLASLGFSMVGLGALQVVPAAPVPVLVCFALTGLGFGGVAALNLVLLADLTFYVEWRHGYRAEGALAAIMSFATKAGAGIGAGLVAYTLAATGFKAGGTGQTAEATHGILLAQSAVPTALGLIGALVFLAYPVDRRTMNRVNADLAARREAGSEAPRPV